MENELRTPYPPIRRAPLRFGGVFGIAWQLYRRSLRGMFPFTLLLIGLPTAILLALQIFSDWSFAQSIPDPTQLPLDPSYFMGNTWPRGIFYLLYYFLVMPAFYGAAYLEMDQAVEGRRGTFFQLLRYALPFGLKRFYTTFLSLLVIGLGIFFAVYLVMIVVMFTSVFTMLFQSGGSLPGMMGEALNVPVIVLIFLVVFLVAAGMCVLLICTYPAAVREQKRAFAAVGRSFQLGWRRFWRILGVQLVAWLGYFILYAPLLLLATTQLMKEERSIAGLLIALVGMLLFIAAIYPAIAAINTALYIDSASRPASKKQRYAKEALRPDSLAQPSQYGKPFDGEPAPPSRPDVLPYGYPAAPTVPSPASSTAPPESSALPFPQKQPGPPAESVAPTVPAVSTAPAAPTVPAAPTAPATPAAVPAVPTVSTASVVPAAPVEPIAPKETEAPWLRRTGEINIAPDAQNTPQE